MNLQRHARILMSHYAPPTVAVGGLIVFWQMATGIFRIPPWLLPSPSEIFWAGYRFRAILPEHTFVTLIETVLGLIAALVIAFPIAILIVWSPILRRALYPIILGLQSIPKVALAPLFLIWVGYGMSSKVLIVASIAFFPILVNSITGLALVERDLLDMIRTLRASTIQTFFKIRIPNSMPYFFSGTKVAVTLAIIGAIVGEFVGSDKGLGYLILVSGSQLNTAMVFVCLIILSVMGAALFGVVAWLQRITCPWSVGE